LPTGAHGREQAPAAAIYHATEHLLPYLATPTVLTVHDLIFERHPSITRGATSGF
jgi:hypothetical protein